MMVLLGMDSRRPCVAWSLVLFLSDASEVLVVVVAVVAVVVVGKR
jgi:hypothetical protein